MNGEAEQQPPDRATQLAEDRTSLALERTIIASERTLMAWIRTAISMIGFGFTIYRFLEYLREAEGFPGVSRPWAPRNLALALVILGVAALLGAIWQHRQFLQRIGATQTRNMWSSAVIIAILVALIGVLVLFGLLLRAGPF